MNTLSQWMAEAPEKVTSCKKVLAERLDSGKYYVRSDCGVFSGLSAVDQTPGQATMTPGRTPVVASKNAGLAVKYAFPFAETVLSADLATPRLSQQYVRVP